MTASSQPIGGVKARIQSLQALRGFAAGMVVVAHSIEHAPGKSIDPVTLSGRFGVDIFFVISGFVILYVAGDGRFRPFSFLNRRFWRIVPLYWALTFVVAALAIVLPSIFRTTQFDAVYLLKSLLFIPAALPGTDDWRPLFKLGWTLNYEIFFYLAVGLLFWCRSMVQRAAVLTAILGALMALSFALPTSWGLLRFYANLNMLPFLAGVWLAVLWRLGVIQRRGPLFARAAVLLAAVATFYFFQIPFWTTKRFDGHLLMSLTATLIGLAALCHERELSRLKASEWLGDISYSLYLVHMFVVGIGWAILNRLGVAPGTPLAILGVVAMIITSLVAATIVYYLFEKPLMRLMPGRSRAAAPADRPRAVA
ncbi:Acyltransferase 3 [Sphingomonas paucimobilis]|nr:Acyltransferase 3 [Sphingomonas paucimobilis]